MVRILQSFGLITFLSLTNAAYASCHVDYTISNDWGNGFTTQVQVTNQGNAWTTWTASWNMTGNQKITGLWRGQHQQNGTQVTVTPYNWNANVGSNSSVSFGFNGSYSGSNEIPTDFSIDGERCSGQPDPSNDDGNNEPEQKTIACEANYTVRNQWNTGFTTDIIIKNLGDQVDDWSVTWNMPDTQTVGGGWNGAFTQQGSLVTVTHAGWNRIFAENGQLSFGFNGKHDGSNPIPNDLAVNGVTCNGQPETVAIRPNAPSSLTARMIDNTYAELSWIDNSNNETQFTLERRLANQSWQTVENVSTDTVRYDDNNLALGEEYEYRIKASNDAGDSNYSNTVSAKRFDHSDIGKQMLVDNCASCHGTDGISTGPTTPTIAGLDKNYLITAMSNYQNDIRHGTIMGRLARGYSTEQIQLISDYLADQTYQPATQETDADNVELGRKIHDENCAVCHTENGRSLVTGSPLAGQWKEYLETTLLDYLENQSTHIPAGMLEQLNTLESRYGDNAIASIVDFYASYPDDSTGYPSDDDDSNSGDDNTGDTGDNGGNENTAPNAPNGLSIAIIDNESVTVNWIDTSNNENGFSIERKTDNTDWIELAQIAANSTSYLDSTVSPATTYAYRISATNNTGSSVSETISTTLLSNLDYGAEQYISQGCATCHGATGTGGITNKPLTHYTSNDLASLTTINSSAMPPANPSACTGNCAASIAEYIIQVLASDTGDEDNNDGNGDSQQQACEGVAPANSRSLRLLTRYEYQNTVNDLLGLSVDLIHELPDENRVLGFDNNIAANQVTSLRLEAFLNKAEELAAQAVSQNISNLLPCQTTDTSCATNFINTFGKRAYRRPLNSTEISRYLAYFSEDSFNSAVEKTIMAMLSSPHMLYRSELGTLQDDGSYQLTNYEVASSLSYLFWGTMPDDTLMQLADQGALSSDTQRLAQAQRLLSDSKSRQQVGNFVGQWLLASNPYALPEKDSTVYPDYTDDVRSSLSQELVNFFNHVTFDSSQKYNELFSSNYVMANNVLANFYALGTQNGADFTPTPVSDSSRTGVLTLGAVLARYSNSNESHPFKRGAFIFERLLCHELPEADNMGIIEAPVVDPNATTRERFAFHSESSESCFSCHQYIDAPGFSLEKYDGSGKFRATENGQSIDTTGILRGLETYSPDEQVSLTGAPHLSQLIADSPNAAECVAKQYYRYTMGRQETTADQCVMNDFIGHYKDSEYNLQTMLLGIVNSPNFIKRQAN